MKLSILSRPTSVKSTIVIHECSKVLSNTQHTKMDELTLIEYCNDSCTLCFRGQVLAWRNRTMAHLNLYYEFFEYCFKIIKICFSISLYSLYHSLCVFLPNICLLYAAAESASVIKWEKAIEILPEPIFYFFPITLYSEVNKQI